MSLIKTRISPAEKFYQRKLSDYEFDAERFIETHSIKQKEYFRSSNTWVMYYGGRRGGKTVGNTSDCIISDQTIEPSSEGRIIFASATIDKVKDLYWRPLIQANKFLKLGWEFKNGDNKIITPRNDIVFRGLRDISKANLDYGFTVKALYLDEAHTIKEALLKHYLENVIEWGLTGVKGAKIRISGNPPSFKMPYLENLYSNPEVKKIVTTMWDNPRYWDSPVKDNKPTFNYINDYVLRVAKRRGYKDLAEAKKDSAFCREVFGEWIYDVGNVVFDKQRIETYEKLPEPLENYEKVIGVDIGGGGDSKDAVVVCLWSRYEDKIYVDYEAEYDSKVDYDLESLASHVKYTYEKYSVGDPPSAVSLDTGGIGARVCLILRQKYGVPSLVDAKKTDKMSYLHEMRTEAHRHRMVFKKGSPLVEEMPQIIFTDDKDDVDDQNGLHSDLLDACLYSFRFITAKFVENKPVKKSHAATRIEEKLRQMGLKGKKNVYKV